MDNALLCTFVVDELHFGIDVTRIQEVIRYQELTPVPLAHQTVRGLINLRGEIVTAIDLRNRLNMPASDEIQPMNVVVAHEEDVVSFLVDEIGDVIEVSLNDFESVPETVAKTVRDVVDGVYKLDDTLLLVLNTDRAMGLDDQAANLH